MPGTGVADKEGFPVGAAARLVVTVLSAQAQHHCDVRTTVQPGKASPIGNPDRDPK